jgi:type I restriction enzyme S subunit
MAFKQVRLGDYFKFEKGLGYKGEFLAEVSEVALIGMDSHEEGGGYKEGSEKPYSGPYKEINVATPGDVIFAATDLAQDGQVLGSPLLVPESDEFQTYIYSHHLLKAFQLKDDFLPEYLYNLFRIEKYRLKAAYADSGTTVRALPAEVLEEQLVPLPDLVTQQAINEIINLVDQQIAINKALSHNLDVLAQSVFKSWFIDFDPVYANKKGERPFAMDIKTSKLFPDSFEKSELGMIPKGWQVLKLGDICKTTIGGLWGGENESVATPDAFYCVRGIEIEDLKIQGLAPRAPMRWALRSNIEKRSLTSNQILIGGSGAGPVGKSILWDEKLNYLFDKPVIFSNFVKRFEGVNQEAATFAAFILESMKKSGEITEFVNGTSVPNLQDADLLNSKIIVYPDMALLKEFDRFVRLLIQKRFSGENIDLLALRGQLLINLIDGELSNINEYIAS